MSDSKTVIVTGGARGIGRAVCLAFAAPGVAVYFNCTAESDASRETAAAITAAGGRAVCAAVDVTDDTAVSAFVERIVKETGQIDVLVNNAGIARDNLLLRMKPADWDAVIDTNLKGTFLFTRHVSKPMLKKRYGRIINVTSVIAATGNPGQANYAASKAGIIGFTKSVARELASRNITVNAVAPGFIETDMTAEIAEKVKTEMTGKIPLGRLGTPEDVAGVALFLASDAAGYITGQVLHVNGGMYM